MNYYFEKNSQIGLTREENIELKKEFEKNPDYKLMEQQSLPGIEPGREPTRVGIGEEDLEKELRQKEKNKQEKKENTQLILGDTYSVRNYFPTETKSITNIDFKYPPVSWFPELNIDLIGNVIMTKEGITKIILLEREKILNDSNISKEKKEEQINFWNNYLTHNINEAESSENCLNVYNEFREKYYKFYNFYLWAINLLEKAENPFQTLERMKNESFVDLIKGSINLFKKALSYNFAKKILNVKLPIAVFQKEKKSVNSFKDAIKVIDSDVLSLNNLYLSSLSSLDEEKDKVDDFLNDPEMKKYILYKDNIVDNEIKEKMLKVLFNHLGIIIESNFYHPITFSILEGNLKPIIDQVLIKYKNNLTYMDEDIRKLSNKITDLIREKSNDLWKDIKGDLSTRKIMKLLSSKDAEKIDEYYQEFKSKLQPYFDLNKLEKMFNFGVFTKGGRGVIDDDKRLAFKANIIYVFLKNFKQRVPSEFFSEEFKKELEQKLLSYNATDDELIKIADNFTIKIFENFYQFIDPLSVIGWIEDELEGNTNFRAVTDVQEQIGDFSGKALIENILLKPVYKNFDKNILNKYLFKKLKSGDYSFLRDLLTNNESDYFNLLVSLYILKNNNKLTVDNIDKIKDILPNIKLNDDGKIIRFAFFRFYEYLPSGFNINYLAEIIGAGVKNIESLQRDISGVYDILKMVHNKAENISVSEIKQILENNNIKYLSVWNSDEEKFNSRDSVKKFYELYTQIMGMGGVDKIIENYKDVMDKLKNNINPDLEGRLNLFVKLIQSNVEINPSSKNFRQILNLIKTLTSDLNLIINYKGYKVLFEEASKVKKNENLFKLNMDISNNIRFRVLPDLDNKYFLVGDETDCCQTMGGAGVEAMVDSFINPMAGVLVLENKIDEDWETVAQSYFHYVPPDAIGEFGDFEVSDITDDEDEDDFYADDISKDKGGYILDNIEISPKFRKGINGVPIEQYYAYWAKEKKKELDVDYIQAGTHYSKINEDMFNSIYFEDDPRSFKVSEPYRDWKPNESNIDLTRPDFEIKIPEVVEDFKSIANLSWKFLGLTLGIPELSLNILK